MDFKKISNLSGDMNDLGGVKFVVDYDLKTAKLMLCTQYHSHPSIFFLNSISEESAAKFVNKLNSAIQPILDDKILELKKELKKCVAEGE